MYLAYPLEPTLHNTINYINFLSLPDFTLIVVVVWAIFFNPLLDRTLSRGRCWAAIQLSGHQEPSGRAVHGKLDVLKIRGQYVDGLFFCATLTCRRSGHTLFVQARAETSDTSAEVVKSKPRCCRKGHSRWVGADVGDESITESCSVVQPLRIPLVKCQERRTSDVVITWIDELFCGGHKWVSRFETPCIPIGWTGEHWVSQALWHGVLEIMWLLCDEAQLVGCLWG